MTHPKPGDSLRVVPSPSPSRRPIRPSPTCSMRLTSPSRPGEALSTSRPRAGLAAAHLAVAPSIGRRAGRRTRSRPVGSIGFVATAVAPCQPGPRLRTSASAASSRTAWFSGRCTARPRASAGSNTLPSPRQTDITRPSIWWGIGSVRPDQGRSGARARPLAGSGSSAASWSCPGAGTIASDRSPRSPRTGAGANLEAHGAPRRPVLQGPGGYTADGLRQDVSHGK